LNATLICSSSNSMRVVLFRSGTAENRPHLFITVKRFRNSLGTAPHGWEAENARYYGRLQRGKGTASFPTKHGHGLTSVRLQATVIQVRIRNFIHKGLKKLYADDAARGVPPDTVDKLRKMLAFLDDMEDPEELRALPSWKVHTLTGDRKGTWSLSVTANRRLTFRIDTAEREIYDMDLEDYH